jgi:hypothetical protein
MQRKDNGRRAFERKGTGPRAARGADGGGVPGSRCALRRRFGDALDLRVVKEWDELHGRGAIFAAGPATIEVIDSPQAESIDEVEVGERVSGPVRLALGVADVEGAARSLMDRGAAVVGEAVKTPWGISTGACGRPTACSSRSSSRTVDERRERVQTQPACFRRFDQKRRADAANPPSISSQSSRRWWSAPGAWAGRFGWRAPPRRAPPSACGSHRAPNIWRRPGERPPRARERVCPAPCPARIFRGQRRLPSTFRWKGRFHPWFYRESDRRTIRIAPLPDTIGSVTRHRKVTS